PHLIFGLRKVGHHVAALVVGHHHLGIAGGKIGGFRNHPDARLRSVRAGDAAADVVVVDGDGRGLLGGEPTHRAGQCHRNHRRAEIKLGFGCHVAPLLSFPALTPGRSACGPMAGFEPRSPRSLSTETRALSIHPCRKSCIPSSASGKGTQAPLAHFRGNVRQSTNVPPRSSSMWMRTISSNEFSALKPSSRARPPSIPSAQPPPMPPPNGSSP